MCVGGSRGCRPLRLPAGKLYSTQSRSYFGRPATRAKLYTKPSGTRNAPRADWVSLAAREGPRFIEGLKWSGRGWVYAPRDPVEGEGERRGRPLTLCGEYQQETSSPRPSSSYHCSIIDQGGQAETTTSRPPPTLSLSQTCRPPRLPPTNTLNTGTMCVHGHPL